MRCVLAACFTTLSIVSLRPPQLVDPPSDAQLRHYCDRKVDANLWLVIAILSFIQPLSSITQYITSHLDWLGVLQIQCPLREGILPWTQGRLHLFLLLLVGLRGPERI